MKNKSLQYILAFALPLLLFTLSSCAQQKNKQAKQEQINDSNALKIVKTDAQWKAELSDISYKVTREKDTERPFTGKYWNFFEKGHYNCICCKTTLFKSDTKFDAGCGWPSFFESIDKSKITQTTDNSLGVERIEITCTKCGAHLGHVFDDGPEPTHLRFCVNSASIEFVK
jgi:peptide-methionine (R)-S-oxide reductase